MFKFLKKFINYLSDKLNQLIEFIWGILWEKTTLRVLRYLYGLFYKYVLRVIKRKFYFLIWKSFAFMADEEEIERYFLFIESLGGWTNITTCSCCSKSWHFKILHSFLIDWEKLDEFEIKVLFYEWPYLRLAPSSYSKWIFRRLRILTHMPWRVRKRYRKSLYSSN